MLISIEIMVQYVFLEKVIGESDLLEIISEGLNQVDSEQNSHNKDCEVNNKVT